MVRSSRVATSSDVSMSRPTSESKVDWSGNRRAHRRLLTCKVDKVASVAVSGTLSINTQPQYYMVLVCVDENCTPNCQCMNTFQYKGRQLKIYIWIYMKHKTKSMNYKSIQRQNVLQMVTQYALYTSTDTNKHILPYIQIFQNIGKKEK